MSKLNGVFSRLLRLERAFPEFPEEVRRPAIFSLWFWSVLTGSYLFWALDLLGTDPDDGLLGVGQGYDLVPGTLVAGILVAVWLFLPWDPRASRWRKLAAPAFLVGMFVMDRILPGGAALLYPIAFANGVFLFGFRRGIAYAAATLAVIFADGALTVRLTLSSPTMWGLVIVNTLVVVAAYAAVAVFVIGICASIVEAHRRREETKSLLLELENAHAALQEYAGKARKLAVSEERARMSGEMHDTVGHYLTVVNVQLEAAIKLMDSRSGKAREQVTKAKDLASEALSEVRRSVRALKPLAVEERQVVDALSALARDFEDAGPDVSFTVEGKEYGLSADAELTLYRALQESLTNTLKHSGARRIYCVLTFKEESVMLTVTDDGAGASEDVSELGFGLAALRGRVEAMGGALNAGNYPEGGFAVEVEIPVAPLAGPA